MHNVVSTRLIHDSGAIIGRQLPKAISIRSHNYPAEDSSFTHCPVPQPYMALLSAIARPSISPEWGVLMSRSNGCLGIVNIYFVGF